jgi:hypothetical protein
MLSDRIRLDRRAGYLAALHTICAGIKLREQEPLVDRYGACIAFLRGRPSLEALFSDTEYRRK